MTDIFDFTGKTALITGAASGIGRATAEAFAERGANLVLGDVSEGARETAEFIQSRGSTASFVRTDVADAGSVQALVTAAVERHGRIDAAFNNAGILPPMASFVDMTEADFDMTIAVDLKGVFLCMKYQIKAMIESGGGAIVNTASVAGTIGGANMSAYTAAKHGVVGLTKAGAIECGGAGIRVNAIAPGLIRTPMTESWMADPDMKKFLLSISPMARAAEPSEIAGVVLFLCSPAASFVNGATWFADGGQTAQ